MTAFRTILPPFSSPVSLSHRDRVLCMGSCFAEHIGEKLAGLKFPLLLNPFGILYNPVSLAQAIERILSGKTYTEADLFENLGTWHSFDHHGRFSHPDRSTACLQINSQLEKASAFLKKTNRLVLTFGTAHVFIYSKTGKVVANCHKLPGQYFERRRLTPEEVAGSIVPVLDKLKKHLPELQVITTVSPVRHLRDGLPENQLSKAALLLGLERIRREVKDVHYFPSYELLLDDLRDYRFYEEDMAHPSAQAVDYIWQYFQAAYMEEETQKLCAEIDKIRTAAAHRSFHPESDAHQLFLKKQLEAIERLREKQPLLDFSGEELLFRSQLKMT